MRKLIISGIAMFLLIPFISFALSGGSTYSVDATKYLYYAQWNQSDSTTIQYPETGQVITELGGTTWEVANQSLHHPATTDDPRVCGRITKDDVASDIPKNFTIEVWMDWKVTVNSGFIYEADNLGTVCDSTGVVFRLYADTTGALTFTTSSGAEAVGYTLLLNRNYTFIFVVNETGNAVNLSIYTVVNASERLTFTEVGSVGWRNFVAVTTSARGLRNYHNYGAGGNPEPFIDEIVVFNWTNATKAYNRPGFVAPQADTSPPAMKKINLSSNGGEGLIIFDIANSINGKLLHNFSTNDTTPTFRIHTNKSSTCAIVDANLNFNYSNASKYNPNSICTTQPDGTNYGVCTLPVNNQTTGLKNFSIGCKDSNNNENKTSTSGYFTVNITGDIPTFTLLLNGLNESRKYEYRTIANISATLTGSQVCIDLDAPNYGFNYSCGNDTASFLYNISILRISNFSNGSKFVVLSSPKTLNITSDANTIIQSVSFNITGLGTTSNLNITYGNKTMKKFKGNQKTIYLELNEFIESGLYKNAVNFTYIVGGSKYIYSNLSDIDHPINMSFDISGFDIDNNNEFDYIEYFNGTKESKIYYADRSKNINASMWVFDSFDFNKSIWSLDSFVGSCNLNYLTGYLNFQCVYPAEVYLQYADSAADLRNTTKVSILQNSVAGTGADGGFVKLFATDGTNNIILWGYKSYAGSTLHCSINLTKNSDDYKSYNLIDNCSLAGMSEVYGSDGVKDISSLDFNNQIKFKWEAIHYATIGLYDMQFSGVALGYSANGSYYNIGNITSLEINTTNNVSKATLNALSYYKPNATSINYYLSNLCNNGSTFESVTSGVTHTFTTAGNNLCWRAILNGTNMTTPVIRKIELSVVKSSISNVSIDLNGVNKFTHTGNLNASNSPMKINLTPAANQLNTIKISAKTAGQIMVDNFKINSSVNPVQLNITQFEYCSVCNISFNFTGSGINVSGLEWDFLGSWNYTVSARAGINSKASIIQVYYSNFNASLPKKINWYDVFPSSNIAKNVTPYGQTLATPIWNVSNFAYDERIDIYVKTNETNATFKTCINITVMNSSNQSKLTDIKFKLNNSYQKIVGNISINTNNYGATSKGIWNWWNLGNCSDRFYIPYAYYASICTSCYFEESQLNNFNLIVE